MDSIKASHHQNTSTAAASRADDARPTILTQSDKSVKNSINKIYSIPCKKTQIHHHQWQSHKNPFKKLVLSKVIATRNIYL